MTGVKVTAAADTGCINHFYGSKSYIDKLKKLVDDLLSDGRL